MAQQRQQRQSWQPASPPPTMPPSISGSPDLRSARRSAPSRGDAHCSCNVSAWGIGTLVFVPLAVCACSSHCSVLCRLALCAHRLRILCFPNAGNAEDMYTSEGTGVRRAPSPLLVRSHGMLLCRVPSLYRLTWRPHGSPTTRLFTAASACVTLELVCWIIAPGYPAHRSGAVPTVPSAWRCSPRGATCAAGSRPTPPAPRWRRRYCRWWLAVCWGCRLW